MYVCTCVCASPVASRRLLLHAYHIRTPFFPSTVQAHWYVAAGLTAIGLVAFLVLLNTPFTKKLLRQADEDRRRKDEQTRAKAAGEAKAVAPAPAYAVVPNNTLWVLQATPQRMMPPLALWRRPRRPP